MWNLESLIQPEEDFLTHVNISAGSFGFDQIHNGMYRGLMQFRSADCGLHRVEKLRVAARCLARLLVVSPTSSGSRSQYVQADRCRPTQSKEKKNTERWYGRDGQGRPLRVQGEDKG